MFWLRQSSGQTAESVVV